MSIWVKQEKYIHYRGERICYMDQGEGPALVFLHGWRLKKETWRKVSSYFVKQGYRCICIDLPGFGKSTLNKPKNIEGYATAVFHVLQQLHIQKCVLVGHSFGGKCAVVLAAKNQKRISSLVLCNVSLSLPTVHTLQRRIVRKLLCLGLNKCMRETFTLTHRKDYTRYLRHVCMPIHLLYGQGDFVVPPEYGQEIRRAMPGAHLTIFKRVWHMPYMERRSRFEAYLTQIVAETKN
jgi:pimeloyl-ACP methyl ester carboxylesterase